MGKDYVSDTFKVLIASENLKRLLWYPPQNLANDTPPPLSPTLPSISNDEELNWKVIDDRIYKTSKWEDLVLEPKCRIYLYEGRRNPSSTNKLMVNQEIVIDVFWHEMFDEDGRSNSISKTLDRLLLNKRITGVGKMSYYDGQPIDAPQNYQAYRHIYQVGSVK